MRNLIHTVIITFLMLTVSVSWARDDIKDYSIKAVLDSEQAKAKLGNDVKFYFGNQKPKGKIVKKFLTVSTNKKTNAFNKSDEEACQWVFLSAMITMRNRAIQEGGNAIIDIRSNYRNNLTSSDTTFKCGAGAFVAGAALRGTIVTIK